MPDNEFAYLDQYLSRDKEAPEHPLDAMLKASARTNFGTIARGQVSAAFSAFGLSPTEQAKAVDSVMRAGSTGKMSVSEAGVVTFGGVPLTEYINSHGAEHVEATQADLMSGKVSRAALMAMARGGGTVAEQERINSPIIAGVSREDFRKMGK